MGWGEVKELARMLAVLGMLVTTGMGLSSMAQDAPEVVEVPDVPAAEMPAATVPYQVVGPAGSAEEPEDAPAPPVGVPLGV